MPNPCLSLYCMIQKPFLLILIWDFFEPRKRQSSQFGLIEIGACMPQMQVVHVEGEYEHGKPSDLDTLFSDRPLLLMTFIIASMPSKHKFHPPAKNRTI